MIVQAMNHLIDETTGENPCENDSKKLRSRLEMYQFTDPEYTFILEKNIKLTPAMKTITKIIRILRNNPDENFVMISLFSCHGMVYQGR